MILEEREKRILKKEEEERRKIAEEKMRRNIRIEMEEKSLREAADNMRVNCLKKAYCVVALRNYRSQSFARFF